MISQLKSENLSVIIRNKNEERWIGHAIRQCLEFGQKPETIYDTSYVPEADSFYEIDISSKNPLHSQSRYEQYELTI